MYINEIYPGAEDLKSAAKELTGAAQDAARGLDTIQELVLIEFGMPSTARFLHDMAHSFPPFFDKVGDILHQRFIAQVYPATAEYTERPNDLDEVFAETIRILDKVGLAAHKCVTTADEAGLHALARQFETLETENSEKYTKVLTAWQMYSRNVTSGTSFDNWMRHFAEGGD